MDSGVVGVRFVMVEETFLRQWENLNLTEAEVMDCLWTRKNTR